MLLRTTGLRRPIRDLGYSGPGRLSRYFEGWYIRQVTADHSRSLAVIVGLSLLPSDPHSFIQVLLGPGGSVLKKRFSLEDCHFRRDAFDVRMGANRFTPEFMELDFRVQGQELCGRLEFSQSTKFPVNPVSPSIMGPFAWVPAMECIHNVVSMNHRVDGRLDVPGDRWDFTAGRGYIEKDRGRSMPKQWIWAQTNSFENPGDSLMLSVARIPWLGASFNGHLGFLIHDGHLFRFATYRGTRVSGARMGDDGLALRFSGRQGTLDLALEGLGSGGALDAPVDGEMGRTILEASAGRISAVLRNRSGGRIWSGESSPASIEATGDFDKLLES